MKKALIFSIIIYIIVVFLGKYLIFDKIRENILDDYEDQYVKYHQSIMTRFKALSKEEIESVNALESLFDSDKTYGFVYKDNLVVFEKNLKTTEKYKGSTVRELLNDYSQKTGEFLADNLTDMIQEQCGVHYLRKSRKIGLEMVIWKTANIYDSEYIVGISTPVKKILQASNYYKYQVVYILSVTVILLLLLFIYYIISIKNK